MPLLSLQSLDAHPDNANRMPAALKKKLTAHIRETGEYPRLIVRPHPHASGRFQILDGHHRADILRQLGYEQAQCEVWHADDDRAAMLLLTLNRLHGEDDPERRGRLIARLSASIGIDELARLLPDESAAIQKLLSLCAPPPSLAPPPPLTQMPEAVTFFLLPAQRERLMRQLQQINRDRSAALVQLLQLGDDACAN